MSLSPERVKNLNKNFHELYKTKKPMDLLIILADVERYLNEESSLIRHLTFTDDNWRFREMLKLRRDAIRAEINRR
jgi:hypothetical protein